MIKSLLSDPEVLTKLEKGLCQMSTSLRTLSKACGLMAVSGTKSTRKSARKENSGAKLPQETGAPKMPGTKSTHTTAETIQWQPSFTPREFLASSLCFWGKGFANGVLRNVLARAVRADRFSNKWTDDPTRKSGWRKISDKAYRRMFCECELFIQACQEIILDNPTYNLFVLNVGSIRQSKWNRREGCENAKLTYEEFVKYTREVHCELPPLRG